MNIIISALVGAGLAAASIVGGVSAYNSGSEPVPQSQLFNYANA
ncbi:MULTISPECIES: hypothetical protein [unclassified Nocardioides]|nr:MULTISPECIES: hypothetical protein [unclassified Nocardioides]